MSPLHNLRSTFLTTLLSPVSIRTRLIGALQAMKTFNRACRIPQGLQFLAREISAMRMLTVLVRIAAR